MASDITVIVKNSYFEDSNVNAYTTPGNKVRLNLFN